MQIIQEDICPEEYYEQDYFNGEKTKYGYVNYHKEKESSIYNFKKYWKNIARYTKRGRILDAGCATGLFL
ncbi:MAG: hypothetical protein Q7U96_06450, partial [Chloroflexota bacterium]|nr:hypothetical protein [Chloroflexota bacterium]